MKGKLIVLEGTDGSGKKTQAKLLLKALKKHGYKAVEVSFPRYNSFFGKLVAMYLQGEFGSLGKVPIELASLLYTLDRYSFQPQLEKFLKHGKIVVCDRYSYSNFAHQAAKIKSKKKQKEFLEWLYNAESLLSKPSIKIFLDMPVRVSRRLLKGRYRQKSSKLDLHEADLDYLERTRRVYLEIVRKEKNWLHVNCITNRVIKSRREIHKEIWQFVESKL